MGFFLPSETARLVLSYLLDQKFQQTGEKFMGECPNIQELKGLPEPQLRYYSKINGRTLNDVLNEYAGLIDGITSLASEVSQDEFENLQFMPPLKVLKSLEQIIKTRADISGTRVDKFTTGTQTSSICDNPGRSTSTQTPAQNSPPPVVSQTDLNLVNFSPLIPMGCEQKVIEKEDIPRLNSAPKEMKQVEVECVAPYDEQKWVNIGKEKDGMKPQDVQYSQALKPPYHLASFLKMAGNSTKGISVTDKNTMVFVVMQGEVTVVLNTSQFVVGRGDSFFVPPHNTYNILNMKAREAELFLVQYKYEGSLLKAESGC